MYIYNLIFNNYNFFCVHSGVRFSHEIGTKLQYISRLSCSSSVALFAKGCASKLFMPAQYDKWKIDCMNT